MRSPPANRRGPVAVQILAYLSTHRDAQDTVEGIAEWWLLEQRLRPLIAEVKKALNELVANGLVLERRGRDGRVRYRLNPRAVHEHFRKGVGHGDAKKTRRWRTQICPVEKATLRRRIPSKE